MKSNIFILLALALLACGKEPKLESQGTGGGGNGGGGESGLKTIAYVKSLYQGAPRTIGDDIYFEGWIVANDRYGSFYKTVVIQDATGGIELKLDMTDIYRDYWIDSKCKVNCNSLTIGMYGGSVQLGAASDDPQYQTAYIANNIIPSVISGIDGAAEVIPIPLTLAQICAPGAGMSRYINCNVIIGGVQFADGGQGVTWSETDADTNRELVDATGNRISVRTSRMADFAGYLLPEGSGMVGGILGYFNGEYQLKVYDHRLAVMEGDRF